MEKMEEKYGSHMKDALMAGRYAGYFDWLMSLVGGGAWWDDLGRNMVRLFERKYYWVRHVDENIAFRGKRLRDDFAQLLDEDRVSGYAMPYSDETTVLEVLVCLAIQIDDDILYQKRFGNRVAEIFERMIGELGFDCEFECLDEQIDLFLDGDLLLSKDVRKDQTLWEQANVLFGDWFNLENENVSGYLQ